MNERLKALLYPLFGIAVLLALWFAAVRVFKVPNYILPSPESVAVALKIGYIDGLYWKHFAYTLQSMAIGYVIGCSIAFTLGCLFAESRTVEQLFSPIVVSFQSMPKVALAPLILVWFGFDLASKVVMVALVCFFPMFVNTVVGLKSTNPAIIDLMRAFSASRFHILMRIKVPSAAGHLFAGLQIAIVMSLIGAVVAEFVSSTRGLGYLISAAAGNMDTSAMFAGLASLAFIGIVSSALVRWVQRKVVFWERAPTEQGLVE
ncbi:MAG: ABC transporter permease [Pseudomonadota bacterium]|nr:ABC transporter permease [Pseudomonadota bacterium]